jgi:hypothetical protein
MVLDSIIIESMIIMNDLRRCIGILLGDEEGTRSVRTLGGTNSAGSEHFFKEIDEGIEANVWDPIVASIDVLVGILAANTVPRSMWVGFDVPQLLNEDISILFVDFRSDPT